MTLALLPTLQEFCDRNGLDRPSVVMQSPDDTIRQLRSLANEVITDITSRGTMWQALAKRCTPFAAQGQEIQGAIATLAPYGFKSIVPDTLFDLTQRRPLFGPKRAASWEEGLALTNTGPFYAWRIWQGNFCLQPNPPAGDLIVFEYTSDMAILAVDGVTWKKRFTADSDVFALDEDLMLSGLTWKWRRKQGLSYAQEKTDFEAMLAQHQGDEPGTGEINLEGGSGGRVQPGIIVPTGNWLVGQ